MNELRQHVEVWRSTCASFSALAHVLTAEQWRLPTDCRGWGVGDLVAHAAALESELAGVEPLRVTIDKAAPHIKSPAGVYTERGVVARRGRAPADVVAEFDDAVSRRTAILEAEALDDPEGTPTVTPGGIGWSWATLMRNRPLDIWVHEQDIRRAIGRPGGLDTAGARHAQSVFAAALPYVVAKRAEVPAGITVVFDVTGPVTGVYTVEVNESGRGVLLDSAPDRPSVRLTLDTESFTILGAGRRDPSTLPIRVEAGSDAEAGQRLADRILAAMPLTP